MINTNAIGDKSMTLSMNTVGKDFEMGVVFNCFKKIVFDSSPIRTGTMKLMKVPAIYKLNASIMEILLIGRRTILHLMLLATHCPIQAALVINNQIGFICVNNANTWFKSISESQIANKMQPTIPLIINLSFCDFITYHSVRMAEFLFLFLLPLSYVLYCSM